MSDDKTVKLKAGDRLRMHGTTYQATAATDLPADMVPVTPQATRLRKVFCETCGYTARITARWIRKGLPACPNSECPDKGRIMIEAEAKSVAPSDGPVTEAPKDEADKMIGRCPECGEYLGDSGCVTIGCGATETKTVEPPSALARLLAGVDAE